jgi:hypothetical protein
MKYFYFFLIFANFQFMSAQNLKSKPVVHLAQINFYFI